MQDPKPTPRFATNATASDHFAWLRTRLAEERTLLAWVRTSVSLIGFGFTIVQFFERINGFDEISPAKLPEAPRYLGLALILTGVVALIFSVFEYRQTNTYLRSGDFAPIAGPQGLVKRTPVYAVAIALCFIGLFCFLSILLRLV